MTSIVTGDDVKLAIALKKDGAVFAIASNATVQAALVSQDRSTVLAGPVACSNVAVGANWAQALVIVQIPSADTGAIITYAPALLEIQVDDGGKSTWFVSVEIVKGNI